LWGVNALKKALPILAVALAAAAFASAALAAGVVQTFDGRLEGDVSFADGRVDVGGKPAAWDATIYVLPPRSVRTLGACGAVRFAGGEVWQADIVGMAAKKLTVRLALFGKQEIDLAQVAGLDFLARLPRADGLQAGVLYRDKGEPVPGSLLWIDEGRLAIDSPLGVLTLSRDGAVRYVMAGAAARLPDQGTDEVGLVDGSILRGRAKSVPGGVRLEHPLLGAVTLDAAMVRFVARRSGRVVDLAGLKPESVTAPGLLATLAPGATVEYRRADELDSSSAACLAAMTVQPKTVVRYRLDAAASRGGQFVARLAPADGARGDVRVKVLSGGRLLLEQDLAPGAAPVAVKADVPAGETLELAVDFGARPLLPCGARFEDPMLILAPGAGG
jgi:hypothetical protein